MLTKMVDGEEVEMSAEEEAEIRAEWAANEAAMPPVPDITKAQTLLYLLSIGKTEDDVEAAIALIPDPTERAVAQIEWRHRQTFRASHPMFERLGPALGITDIPAAFRAAATF